MRVLVVDDDFLLLRGLKRRLSGYETYVATDGTTALDRAGKYQPDAILVDVNLMGCCGLDLITSLKFSSPEAVVIVITGDPSDEIRACASSLCAHALVAKTELPLLPELIDYLVSAHRAASSLPPIGSGKTTIRPG